MTDLTPSPSATFLDGVVTTIHDTLAALDRHDASLGDEPVATAPIGPALGRLEENLTGSQGILGAMADEVRTAQDDLAVLDVDLRRALDAFGAARKYLQGA